MSGPTASAACSGGTRTIGTAFDVSGRPFGSSVHATLRPPLSARSEPLQTIASIPFTVLGRQHAFSRSSGEGEASCGPPIADPQFEPRFLDRDLRPSRSLMHSRGMCRSMSAQLPCRPRDDRVLEGDYHQRRPSPSTTPTTAAITCRIECLAYRVEAIRRAGGRATARISAISRRAKHGAYTPPRPISGRKACITPLKLYDRGEFARDVMPDDREECGATRADFSGAISRR